MIAVIILNWNNAPDTLECLQSVYSSDDPHYAVYVVDNGSSDDSLLCIQRAYPQCRTIPNPTNLGFAQGNNRAITRAIADGSKYLFLLNNDATVRSNTLSLLRKAAEEHPNAGALGPKIYFYDEPTTIWYAGGEWDEKNAICYHRFRNMEDSTSPSHGVEPTCYVCGCALFTRASTIEKIGLMDPRFFLNWEEIDWCWRMRKAGLDCLVVYEAKAWHKMSRSFIGGKRGAMWQYYFYRNRLLWMERHLSRSERWHQVKQNLWPELKMLIREAFGTDPVCYRAALLGIRDYFLRRFYKGSISKII